jgi:hypothetical protein
MALATLPPIDAPATAAGTGRSPVAGRVVWTVAALAVAVRLPFVNTPAGADEAGFLQVAHQWAPRGGSLYGHYWVDRPPLLITLFRVADLTGGLTSLRLLGCVAVAVTVLLCGRAAGLVGGTRAASWAALASAAMLVSPFLGSQEVNGELLSVPFVAAGLAALIQASRTSDRRHALVLSALAGAAGVCALMVKQNIIDVLVFGAVLLVAGARCRTIAGARDKALAAVAGGIVAVGVIAAWTAVHGTSPISVFDAMYPFRLHAAQVVAAGGSQYASGRGVELACAFVTSGAALLAAVLVVGTARKRAWDPVVLALTATLAYDAVSIALGGGYWLHYLVEGAVPIAVWTGLVVARGATTPRLATLLVSAVSLVGLAFTGLHPSTSSGQQVGAAIARVARPGDTLTTLYGEAQVNLAAGLSSPYQHLWSLPTKTLDPQLTGLDAVLSGPTAPTWLVVSHSVSSWGLDTVRTQALISTDYHPVAEVDGQTIYLHDGADRATPAPTTPDTINNKEQP